MCSSSAVGSSLKREGEYVCGERPRGRKTKWRRTERAGSGGERNERRIKTK